MNARTPGRDTAEAVPASRGGAASSTTVSTASAAYTGVTAAVSGRSPTSPAPATAGPTTDAPTTAGQKEETTSPPSAGPTSPQPAAHGAGGATGGRPAREPRPVDPALEELWKEFKATGDGDVRERLILHYAPLVKYVAGRVGVGLPPNIEQADLVSYGIFGLIDAIEKFDVNRAIKFETYAISRIKGAIIDELRSIDWIPRSIRSKAREVERAYAALEAKLHRTPTEPEVAAELGIKLDDLHAIFGQVSFVNVVAL